MPSLEQVRDFALLSLSALAVPSLIVGVLYLRARLRRFDGDLYSVAAPANVGRPEQFFMALHGLLRPPLRRLLDGQPWLSLELSGRKGRVSFQVWIPKGERPFIESLLRAAYPGIELAPAVATDIQGAEAVAEVQLARGNYLPIQTEFDGESLTSVLWTLSRPRESDEVTLQLLVKLRISANPISHFGRFRSPSPVFS